MSMPEKYQCWVRYVPPLRGLLLPANTVPPLPWWATLFRPCRDWNAMRRAISALTD